MTPLLLDVACLISAVLCTFLVLIRDFRNAPILFRAAFLLFMFSCYAQAMRMLGSLSEHAHFPWPRLVMDAATLALVMIRAARPKAFARA